MCLEGNDAIREVRIMYDLYNGNEHHEQSKPPLHPASSADKSTPTYRAVEVTVPYAPKWFSSGIIYPWSHPKILAHGPSESVMTAASTQHHPQYYVEQNIVRPYQSETNKITIKNVVSHKLIRGRPLFVEIDFVPSKFLFNFLLMKT